MLDWFFLSHIFTIVPVKIFECTYDFKYYMIYGICVKLLLR